MKTTLNPTITIDFRPEEYFLVHDKKGLGGEEWYLAYRIDMSNKGKPDQVGGARLHLFDNFEVEEFKKYFEVIEI